MYWLLRTRCYCLNWLDTETEAVRCLRGGGGGVGGGVDLESPRGLGRYSSGPSGILNHVDPSVSVSNLYLDNSGSIGCYVRVAIV